MAGTGSFLLKLQHLAGTGYILLNFLLY
uniref:Uncharacterized protein n=1 Tax=Arundo donax TaxID=35708 RepID=A0A0A9GL57_ARUDO